MLEYNREVSVTYRFIDVVEQPRQGERLYHLMQYHHPTQTHFCKRLVVTDGSVFHLVNEWNRQPKSGWQYYID